MENNIDKTILFPEIVEQFTEVIERANKLIFFVCDIDLQKEMIKNLKDYCLYIKSFKKQAKDYNNEEKANQFFYMQCIINSYISTLSIWISLKESTPQSAWNNLINAQEYLSYAERALNGKVDLSYIKKHLTNIEDVIFRGFPLYNSLGIIKKRRCLLYMRFCDRKL